MAPARTPSRISTGTFSRREVLNSCFITPPGTGFQAISLAFAIPSAGSVLSRNLLAGMTWSREARDRGREACEQFFTYGDRCVVDESTFVALS